MFDKILTFISKLEIDGIRRRFGHACKSYCT